MHGWPVKVSRLDREGQVYATEIVAAGCEAVVYFWDGCDLLIHEIQPEPLAPAPDP
jgi:hypothetical protein